MIALTGGRRLDAAASEPRGIKLRSGSGPRSGVPTGDAESWVAVAALLDLLKAFEQVRHHWLLDAAIATGFPLWHLKLTL